MRIKTKIDYKKELESASKTMIMVCSIFISVVFPSAALPAEIPEPLELLSSLPEDQIDIGSACLMFSKEAYPDLDFEEYSERLDEMVREIQRYTRDTGNHNDPDHRIRCLNSYLYKYKGFHYDKEDPYGQNLKNRYLNGLLDSKSGSCLTMPLLYLALAQRLGYPIYPVSAPQHLFLRYVDSSLKMQNIEAASQGGFSSNEDYIRDMEIPDRGIESGAYLKTMSYKELLAELFAENACYWAKNRNGPRATSYFEQALKLNPNAAEVYRIFGNHYIEMAQFHVDYQDFIQVSNNPIVQRELRRGQLEFRNQLISLGNEFLRKADELGVAPPLPKDYWLIQEKNRKEHQLSMGVKP